MTEYRPPTVDDFPAIVDLACDFLANHTKFNGHVKPEREHIINELSWLAINGWIMLVVIDGVPMGILTAKRMPMFFSSLHYVQDSFMFVRPEAKGKYSFRKLFRMLDEWAFSEPDCAGISISDLGYVNVDGRLSKALDALGYPTLGNIHIKKRFV